jgi:hypothetical protein
MNEGTPSVSEYNKPMAGVLKGPTTELYLYLYYCEIRFLTFREECKLRVLVESGGEENM